MEDFKLKVILTILSGILFSFIFIILAFSLPTPKKAVYVKKGTGKLEQISQSLR
jgi:hypothetical protein